MRKTYQFYLHPTRHQCTLLNETLEICRWVYNEILAVRKNAYDQEKKTLSCYDTMYLLPALKNQNSKLDKVYSQILSNVCTRVDLAFKGFFRRVKAKENPGYPRFRGRGRYDSFTYPQSGFKIVGDKLVLSKIGAIKINQHRTIEGKIKTLTIKRNNLGNWYALFSCEVEEHPLPPTDKVVGVDLGLTTFAVLSDGTEIKRERWMNHDAKDIARLQRKKEKLPKGSAQRKKAIRALQHAYKRQANKRNNFAHQESRKLVNKYQFMAFENLDIQSMQSNKIRTINKGIADVAWKKFIQCVAYKAEYAGRSMVLVDPKNTSQMCSNCGKIVPKDLSVRVHKCPYCGLEIDRDLNAALNILARGLTGFRQKSIKAAKN